MVENAGRTADGDAYVVEAESSGTPDVLFFDKTTSLLGRWT